MRAISFSVDPARAIPALIKVQRGLQTIRFTTWNETITDSEGTWPPGPGANITNVQFPSDGSAASVDIAIYTGQGSPFSPGEGARGFLDGWPVTIKIIDIDDPNNGYSLLPGGNIANVNEARGLMTISVQGPLNRTQKPLTGHYSLTGREDLGDDSCKIPIRPSDIGRNEYFVPPSIATGLIHVDDAYGRMRSGNSGTPVDYNNVYYEAVNTGSTGGGAPHYNSSLNGQTQDGGVTFVARNSWCRHARGGAIDQYNIKLDYMPDPRGTDPTWFVLGNIWICSGYLAGYPKIPIRSWDPTTLIATTFLPLSVSDIPAGTWMEIAVGCDTTAGMCFARFNNIKNLRAETFVPPANTLG